MTLQNSTALKRLSMRCYFCNANLYFVRMVLYLLHNAVKTHKNDFCMNKLNYYSVIIPVLATILIYFRQIKRRLFQVAFLVNLSNNYLMIFATTPAPTVRPPSRIAKRKPWSIAIGWIRDTVILMLSPGITISTPSGNSIVPVTSVVRK